MSASPYDPEIKKNTNYSNYFIINCLFTLNAAKQIVLDEYKIISPIEF